MQDIITKTFTTQQLLDISYSISHTLAFFETEIQKLENKDAPLSERQQTYLSHLIDQKSIFIDLHKYIIGY